MDQYNEAVRLLTPYVGEGASSYWIVFDIDGVLLSDINVRDRYRNSSDVFKYMTYGCFTGIQPMIDLYVWCQEKGFKVCLLTGRWARQQVVTLDNLRKVGITSHDRLFMRSHRGDTAIYKTSCRKLLEVQGERVLLNIGDQDKDLEGGYSIHTLKIPSTY